MIQGKHDGRELNFNQRWRTDKCGKCTLSEAGGARWAGSRAPSGASVPRVGVAARWTRRDRQSRRLVFVGVRVILAATTWAFWVGRYCTTDGRCRSFERVGLFSGLGAAEGFPFSMGRGTKRSEEGKGRDGLKTREARRGDFRRTAQVNPSSLHQRARFGCGDHLKAAAMICLALLCRHGSSRDRLHLG